MVAFSTLVRYPKNAGIGIAILALGALIYPLWRGRPSLAARCFVEAIPDGG
jgi:hypothetical protein